MVRRDGHERGEGITIRPVERRERPCPDAAQQIRHDGNGVESRCCWCGAFHHRPARLAAYPSLADMPASVRTESGLLLMANEAKSPRGGGRLNSRASLRRVAGGVQKP